MSDEEKRKCPGCGGDLLWMFGLAGGGDAGYYEFCGANIDCGYFFKPDSNGDKNCFIFNEEEK